MLDAPNEFICNRSKPLWNVPQMTTGNRPADGGNLIIEKEDYEEFMDTIRVDKEYWIDCCSKYNDGISEWWLKWK